MVNTREWWDSPKDWDPFYTKLSLAMVSDHLGRREHKG